jgi:hypothetical protein
LPAVEERSTLKDVGKPAQPKPPRQRKQHHVLGESQGRNLGELALIIFGILGGVALGGGLVYVIVRRLYGARTAQAASLPALTAIPAPALTGVDEIGIHWQRIQRYTFAASRDTSPTIGLTHASYALALLDTLNDVVGEEALVARGINYQRTRAQIAALQDKYAAQVSRNDPQLSRVLAAAQEEDDDANEEETQVN